MNETGRIKLKKLAIAIIMFILLLNLVWGFLDNQSSVNQVPSGEDVFDVGGNDSIEIQTEVYYHIASGSRIAESVALYIKQSLISLGIDVKLVIHSWGQMVGEILKNSNDPSCDLFYARHGSRLIPIHYQYGSKQIFPSLLDKYHSGGFGSMLYPLDPETQQIIFENTETFQNETDALLEKIDHELSHENRILLLEEFTEFFQKKMLYEVPLVYHKHYLAMWKGFGGENNELWDPTEGIIGSQALGARWEEASLPEERKANKSHANLYTIGATDYVNFDPMQAFDEGSRDLTRHMHGSLLRFDSQSRAHPDHAYNYFRHLHQDTDHDYNASTPKIDLTEYRFFIRDDAYWSNTGNSTTKLNANDFKLALDVYMHPEVRLHNKIFSKKILGYNVSSTISANDTFSVYINSTMSSPSDVIDLGTIQPLPSYRLSKLTWHNQTSNTSLVGDVFLTEFDPHDSLEWQLWTSLEGHSLVGPYEIISYLPEERYGYQQRLDYYFPNEQDSIRYYNAVAFKPIEQKTGFNLSIFAPHENPVQPASYYWNFGEGPKSDEFSITSFDYHVIQDINRQILMFEAGELDIFPTSALGSIKVNNILEDARFVQKTSGINTYPDTLVFNLKHEYLSEYKVRLAIAKVIDKEKIVEIHENLAEQADSLLPLKFRSWARNYDLPYDYEGARDLMRAMGYFPLMAVPDYYPPASSSSVISGNTSETLLFALAAIYAIRRKRKI